jgi:hypothetical protein
MTTGGHNGTYPTMSKATCGDAEGLSTYEAAEITGIGQAAFKSRLNPGTAARPSRHQRPGPGHRRWTSRLAGHRPHA